MSFQAVPLDHLKGARGNLSHRIAWFLSYLSKDRHINWTVMGKELKEATHVQFDRRRLEKLSSVDSCSAVSLKLYELEALDTYFTKYGFSLLGRPKIIEELVACGTVSFFIGSYARTECKRTDISRWDVKALTEVLRGIDRYRPGTKFEIHDIIKSDLLTDISDFSPERNTNPEKHSSVCCLGSPRANRETEYMLCKMFGIPTCDPDRAMDMDLPFAFAWRQDPPVRSSFAVPIDQLLDNTNLKNSHEEIKSCDRAIRVNKTVRQIDTSPDSSSNTYGILAAQRRQNGQIWLVLAGLTGPATYAVAEAVASDLINTSLDKLARHSPSVLCSGVAIKTSLDKNLPGDNRVLDKTPWVFEEPFIWSPR